MACSRGASVWLAVTAIAVGGAGWTPSAGVLRAAPEPARLNLHLTAVEDLPPSSRHVLISEAAAIWKHEGVHLRWLSGSERATGATLRILVVPRTVGAPPDGDPWPVAELLRFEDSRALAIASISGALRVVDQSQRATLFDLPDLREYRLGRVLGRAVAHEIGHYLLQSNTHAESGLMRARIDAHEFADAGRSSFRLDEAAKSLLRNGR